MADEFNECLEAASYIIKRCGLIDQNSVRACIKGRAGLRFERTKTNDIEVTVNGKVVLFAPPPGSIKQVIWEPGNWVQEILEIKERVEHSVSVNEQERISRAKEYCEGYTYGIYAGRKYSAPEDDAGGPSYRAGFARGVSAANRAKYCESSRDESAREIISDAIRRLEDDYRAQTQSFTEEQWKKWKSLQASIKRNGEREWQDFLLELYDRLEAYKGGAILAKDEMAAIELVRTGVVKRLAKTSLVLPVPG